MFSRLELPGQSLPVEVEPEILLCLSSSKGIGITLEMSPVLEKSICGFCIRIWLPTEVVELKDELQIGPLSVGQTDGLFLQILLGSASSLSCWLPPETPHQLLHSEILEGTVLLCVYSSPGTTSKDSSSVGQVRWRRCLPDCLYMLLLWCCRSSAVLRSWT